MHHLMIYYVNEKKEKEKGLEERCKRAELRAPHSEQLSFTSKSNTASQLPDHHISRPCNLTRII